MNRVKVIYRSSYIYFEVYGIQVAMIDIFNRLSFICDFTLTQNIALEIKERYKEIIKENSNVQKIKTNIKDRLYLRIHRLFVHIYFLLCQKKRY